MDKVLIQRFFFLSQELSRLLKASDETKRKMYSSILVVGGGLMFHGAQEFLLHRIINKMPPSFRRLVDSVEVITRPKVKRGPSVIMGNMSSLVVSHKEFHFCAHSVNAETRFKTQFVDML